MDLEDRQAAAIASAIALAVIPPVLVAVPLLMASAWAHVMGVHGVHHLLWGWLSDSHQDARGHWHDGVGEVPILYWLSIPTAYAVYQISEGLAGLFRAFKALLDTGGSAATEKDSL